jgi:hypothetical protein
LKEKYPSHMSMHNWIQVAIFKQLSDSKAWNNFLKLVPLIINWHVWKPRSSHLIDIGMERILGLGEVSFLSASLLKTLKKKGVSALAQARSPQIHESFMTNWTSNEDLALVGNLVKEWDRYRRALLST